MVDAFIEEELAGKALRRPRREGPEHVRGELEAYEVSRIRSWRPLLGR